MSGGGKEMLPYQQRVIDEKKELDIKLERLVGFIVSPHFLEVVGLEERRRLTSQAEMMKKYSAILGERIGAM